MRIIGSKTSGAGVVAVLLTLVGCGMSPTTPNLDSAGGASSPPPQSSVSRPAASADRSSPVLDPLQAPPEALGARTVQLDANVNAKNSSVLELANVRLWVPKNAFPGSARISMVIPDASKPEVHLTITPASKNHFKTPMVLEFSPGTGQDVRVMTIYWFDGARARWVPMPTTVDAAGQRLTTELSHFSEYKAGCEAVKKSGW